MKKFLLITACLFSATATSAMEADPVLRAYALEVGQKWANNPAILSRIQSQNAATAALTEAEILALDTAWRAEVGQPATPTITPILENAASDYLRSEIEASEGRVVEVFAMDARGLNAATSGVTSDYWQGDEDKFQKSHGAGAGAVHVSEVEFDESSQTFLVQVSIVVLDPQSQAPIGAMTLGLNAELF